VKLFFAFLFLAVAVHAKVVHVMNATVTPYRVDFGTKILCTLAPGATATLDWDFVSDGLVDGNAYTINALTTDSAQTVHHTRTGVVLTEDGSHITVVVYGSIAGAENIHYNSSYVAVRSGGSSSFAFAGSVDDIIVVAAATMALGVTLGGLPFAVRFLWRFFQKLLGGSTWRE